MKPEATSKAFQKRNAELIGEFNTYLLRHLELLDDLPHSISIAITVKSDEAFSKKSLAVVEKNNPEGIPIVEARKVGRRWVLEQLQPTS